jgi:hypothetical protein
MPDSRYQIETRIPRGDEKYVEIVNSRAEHALNQYTTYFRKLARWYDLFRGIYSGNFQSFRNNLHIPFLFSVVQSDVARKVQTSFGGWPIVEFAGYSPEDEPIARKNQTLISAQMKDANSFVKAVDFFTTADLYGTAICRHGWKKVTRQQRVRVMDQFSNREFTRDVDHVDFNGPDWEVVDPLDFWPQPGSHTIEDMGWVVHRYYLDLDTLKEMAATGLYDYQKIGSITSTNMPQESEMTERYGVYRSFGQYQARMQEKFAKPVEIREMWGLVPDELAIGGVRNVVLAVANRTTLIRRASNPYWHGKIPFISYAPCRDPHYFHGVGKCEVGEKPQLAANRLANQKLDALDLFIDPVFLMNRQSGIDTQNLYLRAGRVIGVDGPVDDTQIRPISPDLRGLQQSYQEIAQLSQWIQQGTGIIEDVVAGMPSSGRQTAREFLGRQENVLTRLMLEARLAEEGFVEPLANAFRELDRQYLTFPHEVKILGSSAVINPVTGLPLPQEQVKIGLEDLAPEYRARAVGATQMLGKGVRQQNLISVLQALSANPVMLQAINWVAFARKLLDAFDLTGSDLINQQMTLLNQMSMQQGQGGQGQPEQGQEAYPGAPQNGGGMEALNPEILSAMMGGQGVQ